MSLRLGIKSILPVIACCLAGCGGGSPTGAPESQSSGSTTASAPAQGADEVVFDFLEAVRKGNDEVAASLLTPLARQKTEELDLIVAPPGSDTASFSIDGVEQITDVESHVASRWSDVDPEGETHTDEILWILRRVDSGWRIAGMATKLLDFKVPLLLNFEDPEDMLKQQRIAEQQIEKHLMEQQEALQAERPTDSIQK